MRELYIGTMQKSIKIHWNL